MMDLFLVLVQVMLLAACGWLTWQVWMSVGEARELVESAEGTLAELKRIMLESDRLVEREQDPVRLEEPLERGGPVAAEAAWQLYRLGMSSGEVAHRLGISRGEAELVATIGREGARKGGWHRD